MPTYRLRHFSKPEILKTVSHQNLRRLLGPHHQFFISRGIDLNDTAREFEFERLAEAVLADSVPTELVEALNFIDHFSTNDGVDVLTTAIESIDFQAFFSPADIAVQAWLLDPEVVEHIFAERAIRSRHRSYQSFRAARSSDHKSAYDHSKLERLRDELNATFRMRGRGEGTRILSSANRQDGHWFLIRHGEMLRREGCLEDGESSSIFFRPERYDAVVFDPETSDLRIAARPWETQVYRRAFGRLLFGADDSFPHDFKYTLQPLITDGEASLYCGDVPSLGRIRLVGVRFRKSGHRVVQTLKDGVDLYASIAAGECRLPGGAQIEEAKFRLEMTNAKRPRLVTVCPPNVVRYAFDDDASCVEEWLIKRDFIIAKEVDHGEA